MAPHDEKRAAKRVKPTSPTDIRVAVQGVACELCNISDYGLGIRIESPTSYHLGQRIADIRMSVAGRHPHLRGSIAHINRTSFGNVLGVCLEINFLEGYQLICGGKKSWCR